MSDASGGPTRPKAITGMPASRLARTRARKTASRSGSCPWTNSNERPTAAKARVWGSPGSSAM